MSNYSCNFVKLHIHGTDHETIDRNTEAKKIANFLQQHLEEPLMNHPVYEFYGIECDMEIHEGELPAAPAAPPALPVDVEGIKSSLKEAMSDVLGADANVDVKVFTVGDGAENSGAILRRMTIEELTSLRDRLNSELAQR